ncbi:bacterial bifunctional deaminase-reductase [Trametes gibbosa]|nr:bacterial bifunctional deaminase-reductase [Trametes gibbosa]
MSLPHPPSILLDLYGLPVAPDVHPSVFDPLREASLDTPKSADVSRPYVTLTFAQSLDAKIAGAGGKQLILSGKESMVMTHWMRTLHDAILIGIGTALNDNPQLNTRHLPPLPDGYPHAYRMPRPIILDTHLRLPPDCRLLQNYLGGRGRRPWVVCAPHRASEEVVGAHAFAERATALRKAGARVIAVASNAGRLAGPAAISELLATLRALGVRSLMVEGGARVIRSFLSAARVPAAQEQDGKKAIDALVVTVSPTLVGSAGVGYGGELHAEALPTFKHVRTEMFGPDAVMALKVL